MTGVRHAIGIGAFGHGWAHQFQQNYSRESRVPIGRDLDARQGRDLFRCQSVTQFCSPRMRGG